MHHALDRMLKMGTCAMPNRHASDRFRLVPTEWSCSFNGFLHAHRGPAGRVQQRALRWPSKRSVLLAQSHQYLDRLPKRQTMVITSNRLGSTWSRWLNHAAPPEGLEH